MNETRGCQLDEIGFGDAVKSKMFRNDAALLRQKQYFVTDSNAVVAKLN